MGLLPLVGFITGLQTHVGRRVQVGQVRVQVELGSPAQNPYPCPGYGGFGFNMTTRVFTLLAMSKWVFNMTRREDTLLAALKMGLGEC